MHNARPVSRAGGPAMVARKDASEKSCLQGLLAVAANSSEAARLSGLSRGQPRQRLNKHGLEVFGRNSLPAPPEAAYPRDQRMLREKTGWSFNVGSAAARGKSWPRLPASPGGADVMPRRNPAAPPGASPAAMLST